MKIPTPSRRFLPFLNRLGGVEGWGTKFNSKSETTSFTTVSGGLSPFQVNPRSTVPSTSPLVRDPLVTLSDPQHLAIQKVGVTAVEDRSFDRRPFLPVNRRPSCGIFGLFFVTETILLGEGGRPRVIVGDDCSEM